MGAPERRWRDGHGVTHSVVRRAGRRKGINEGFRVMVTRCGVERVPARSLAFGDVDCMACLVATTSRAR